MRDFLTRLPRHYKQLLAISYDAVCICASLWLSMLLRYGHWHWKGPENTWWVYALVALLTALPVFSFFGLYRSVLRYINSVNIVQMLKAAFFAAFLLLVVDALFLPQYVLPRSVPFIYFLFLSLLVVGSRYAIQHWLNGVSLLAVIHNLFHSEFKQVARHGKPALIYGEGKMLSDLISVLDRTRDYHPVVIIDHAGVAVGGEINGRPIYSVQNIEAAIDQFGVDEILLAMPDSSRMERKKAIARLECFGLPIRTMPSFQDLASGRMALQEVQDVDIADVLGRPEVPPISSLLSIAIANKVVMVTGAGGSIGSEIVRQALLLNPEKIILVDHAEFNLYSIERELIALKSNAKLSVDIIPVLASVTDQRLMLSVIKKYGVHTIYHAAAYKHVPLVESNIAQGIINNVWGTLSCAQAAIAADVERFVLISTDKAVRPTNVMGATKRLAEMVLQALNAEQAISFFNGDLLGGHLAPKENRLTRFTMVRFGNVLGSSGSVIPVFKEQIRSGGPITVTHPDINRYFMSIPEAAQLVIQAGAMGEGGDVFLLDMGDSVKIVDLAKRMVSLSGLTVKTPEHPDGDIDIIYTGLRPGEKLYEELLLGDASEKTLHERIFKAHEDKWSWSGLAALLSEIECALQINNVEQLIQCLQKAVSGFSREV